MQNSKNLIFSTLLALACSCLSATTIYAFGSSHEIETATISADDLQRLSLVVSDVKKYYYRKVNDSTLFTNAISGMLSSLDPHSAYLGPEDLKDLEMETSGNFGGIGIEVAPEQGVMKVISPLDGSPASRAGIKAGDYIIQINDKLIRNMTLNQAIAMMRGKKGGIVTLTILRKNESKPFIFKLKREIIKLHTVKERMLEPGYGYVRVAYFQDPTERDLTKAIAKLHKEAGGELKGLILDLRNNPGGLFESSVQVADDFLDTDKLKDSDTIVYTKGQADDIQITAKATPDELIPNVPLVVLINEGSASAAEIVAGALQDHKRAMIVGTRSFGKGSVQTVIPIDKNSVIKLTTALYYTPSGRSIQAKGITPDIVVENLQIPHKKAEADILDQINEANLVDHIQNADENANTTSPEAQNLGNFNKQSIPSSLAYKDYQLYEALQILKSMNVMNHRIKTED